VSIAGTQYWAPRRAALFPRGEAVRRPAYRRGHLRRSALPSDQASGGRHKLVNVQPQPFDKGRIQYDPNAGLGPSTFYTANGVIETDYSLGLFSGTIASDGVPTDFTPVGKPGP
jgi:hypothetical protein